MEAVLRGHFQHIEMNPRIFMTRKSDKAKLALCLCFFQCSVGPIFLKNSIGVLKA